MHGASSAAGVGSAPANAADARKGGAVLACVGPDTGDEVVQAAARLAGAMGTLGTPSTSKRPRSPGCPTSGEKRSCAD
jgi:hypothetical protein